MFAQTRAVQIVACGSSYYTGLVAKYWFEEYAGIPCQVEIASELRYRKTAVFPKTLLVTISQSGETADTLAALRDAKDKNYIASLCLCNVPNSSMVRESDLSLMLEAGIEICVASTKAFTNQLVDLLLLVGAIGQYNELDDARHRELVEALKTLPDVVKSTLKLDDQICHIAEKFVDKDHGLFLGRGSHYPIALEGALKLKEISYIHAEGYPAAEMKHGPIALIDDEMPIVVIATKKGNYEKVVSNIQEVKARGGRLIAIVTEGDKTVKELADYCIEIPNCFEELTPLLSNIPLQLLSYHIALMRGCNVDQPRNLAKSVTVE